MSTESEGFANLKAGDMVVRSHGYAIRTLSLVKVTRVTPKQVYTEHEKFYRADGARIGQSGDGAKTEILKPTKERLATMLRLALSSPDGRARWRELPPDTLKEVVAVVADLAETP